MADGSLTVEMAEIQVTSVVNDKVESPVEDDPISDDERKASDNLVGKKHRSWTRYGLRDRGKSAKTLSDEWWEGKEPLIIRGRPVPVFLMKWVLFLKYEEPPKHISLLQQSAWAWRPRLNFWCILPILFFSCNYPNTNIQNNHKD